MLQKMNLQARLMSAFFLMGLLVFIISIIGWTGTSGLSQHINIIAKNNLPSIDALWKLNEGQTQIESSERALLNLTLTLPERRTELQRIETAWKQINQAFKDYETIPRSLEEDKAYQQMLENWNRWETAHNQLLQINEEFQQLGILTFLQLQGGQNGNGKNNSPEVANSKAAAQIYQQLTSQAKSNIPLYKAAEQSILQVVAVNKQQASQATRSAEQDIMQTQFLAVLAMILGPGIAIILGRILSGAIAKPLDKGITEIISVISTSSNQIAATVAQQEQIAGAQAIAVNQTTTTMDELSASSEIALSQAESATQLAQQALTLTGGGAKAVRLTLKEIEALQQKVIAIASSMQRLSAQADQIGNISGLVGELASKTNMLALNAAVEAVRAGENGKGFGVVATEIRKLADQSNACSEKIKALVKQIQSAVQSTVSVTDEGIQSVKNGVKIAQKSAYAFKQVANAMQEVVVNNQKISLTAKQQAVAISQVVMAMDSINNGARETASGISQTKISTQQLHQSAQHLQTLGFR
ncbi:methyl-accepting chemotaxis protein [Ancylothrix sp. C2]|uniref:HAMP domain-containing methyl-accepting chemotaxis protein n=1 Tax=Ancylothrix sp. D3o TaxID=2953691 RepID=UPI0021BA6556|nr:methyl-accepting chemotaxis protein [Ancylothrix sp. D3o]MCT7948856.1 methyl-accepting chemotaxis protein [Ancylothrix sp. D3o]